MSTIVRAFLVGKTYKFKKKFVTGDAADFYPGMKFKVKKIKDNSATIKIVSPIEDCSQSIEQLRKLNVWYFRRNLSALKKNIAVWEADSAQFVKSTDKIWEDGRIINTGFPVPADHPDKDGHCISDDAIKTFDYKHKKGIKNSYSYQKGKNEWYSKACYEFMACAEEAELTRWTGASKELIKYIYHLITEKDEYSIKKLITCL